MVGLMRVVTTHPDRLRQPALIGLAMLLGPALLQASDPETALVGPPQVIQVPDDELAEAEMLGTPQVRTLVGYTRRVLHLPDGHTLAVFSFSNAAAANWLFLIDARDLSVARYAIPNNDIASHGAALGRDGNIYIMPYGNGRAYRFETSTRRFYPIQVPLPARDYTWDALGTADGRIYFGTYPNAYLGWYDIATGRCTLRRQVVPNTKYTRSFAELADGRIRLLATGPGETWLIYDPQADTVIHTGPPAPAVGLETDASVAPKVPAGDRRFGAQLTAAGRRFAVSFPTSRLWEIAPDGELTLRGDPLAPAEVWFLEQAANAVVGISHFGVALRYDLKSNEFGRTQLPNRAAAGNSIMFIEAVTPRCVIGANYSQQNLFCIDPEDGAIHSADHMIARVTGEPMCAVGLAGKAYLGIYVNSLISVYDPQQPFAFGRNPRELMELGATYQQTRPRAAVTDGHRVYISSDSAYNHLGGALAVIDPPREQVDVHHHVIRDQNLPTLAYDAKTKLVWGGTDRWGQMRSHPPTRQSALIYAFDPAQGAVITTLTPWPKADVANVLGVYRGVLLASRGDQIALIDTAARQILYRGPCPIPVPERIVVGDQGGGYWLAGGKLYRWDLPAHTLTPVAYCPGCVFLTEPSPGTWCAADRRSVYRVQLARGPRP